MSIEIRAFNEVAVTGTDSYYSKMFGTRDVTTIGIHFEWSGSSPSGTTIIQKSNKESPDETTDTDWVTDGTSITGPAGGDGKEGVDLADAGWRYYRLKYTNVTGSGTLNAWVYAK